LRKKFFLKVSTFGVCCGYRVDGSKDVQTIKKRGEQMENFFEKTRFIAAGKGNSQNREF
jgi:hypothetical protein